MRILYASERPPYPYFLGGAARCAHRLLVSLAQEQGVECLAVGSAGYGVSPWALPPPDEYAALGVRGMSPGGLMDCGYPVQVLPDFAAALEATVREFRPDVIWSQLEGAHEVLALAQARGVKSVLYVHDAEDNPQALRAMAELGCQVVCGSAFLARKVEGVIGRPVAVVYPASDWHFGTQGDAQGFVTMVNAYAVKGLDTLLEVARRMPQERFLLQESWKLGADALAQLNQRLVALPNVRFQHRVPDMRAVYGQTRLLLVPSVWEEGFGMVAVEAQSCGIPVIASARGGLPESVGDGGLLVADYKNPAAWVRAIRKLGTGSARYDEMAAAALAHARRPAFSPAFSAGRFIDICEGRAVATASPKASRMADAWRSMAMWGRAVARRSGR